MARRNSFRSAPQPKIRNLRWTGAVNTFLALSAGSSAQAYIGSATDTETLLRQRGQLLCYLDAAQAGSGAMVDVAIGTIVMPEGQGTTVVSSPITDENAPWLYYERFVVGYDEYVTDVVTNIGGPVFRATIDTKAMRILKPDQEVQLVVEQASLNAASPINIVLTDRVLIGEH